MNFSVTKKLSTTVHRKSEVGAASTLDLGGHSLGLTAVIHVEQARESLVEPALAPRSNTVGRLHLAAHIKSQTNQSMARVRRQQR